MVNSKYTMSASPLLVRMTGTYVLPNFVNLDNVMFTANTHFSKQDVNDKLDIREKFIAIISITDWFMQLHDTGKLIRNNMRYWKEDQIVNLDFILKNEAVFEIVSRLSYIRAFKGLFEMEVDLECAFPAAVTSSASENLRCAREAFSMRLRMPRDAYMTRGMASRQ